MVLTESQSLSITDFGAAVAKAPIPLPEFVVLLSLAAL
jgi:hypothetical protein